MNSYEDYVDLKIEYLASCLKSKIAKKNIKDLNRKISKLQISREEILKNEQSLTEDLIQLEVVKIDKKISQLKDLISDMYFDYKFQSRHLNIAYGILKGRKYSEIEKKTKSSHLIFKTKILYIIKTHISSRDFPNWSIERIEQMF